MLWFAAFVGPAIATEAGHRFGLPRDANVTAVTDISPTGPNAFNTSAYCASQMSQYFATYNPTGVFTTSTITDYIGFDDTGEQTGKIVTQSYSTRTITFTKEAYMAWQQGGAKPPCCNTCQLKAGTIEFFWWPDLAQITTTTSDPVASPTNNVIVTAMGKDGLVFTSPTVYMAFSSLYAKNFCGTVGEIWENTTIGFHPSEISTINEYSYTYYSYFTTTERGSTITGLADAKGTRLPPSPLKYADLAQNCSTISGYVYFEKNPQNDVGGGWEHDPCHPVLAIPKALLNMQQAWQDAQCTVLDGYGAYDPPIALTPATAAATPTLPPQPDKTDTHTEAPVTTTHTALPDSQPTNLPNQGIVSGNEPSETTWTIGPPTPETPIIQPSQSDLDTPFVLGTETETRQFKPHVEASGKALSSIGRTLQNVGAGQQQPVQTTVEVFTIIEVTINPAGTTSVLTRTTEAILQPARTVVQATTDRGGFVTMKTIIEAEKGKPGQQVGNDGTVYTILHESTLADGRRTVVPSVVLLGGAIPAQLEGSGAHVAVPIITAGGNVYTANSNYAFDIDGTMLKPGGTVTVDGTTLRLGVDGMTAIINGQTVPMAKVTSSEVPDTTITVGGNILTGDATGGFVVAPGTILSIGGSSVIISGTAYALKTNSAGETLLIAGPSDASSTAGNVAGYIMSVIGETHSRNEANARARTSTTRNEGSTATREVETTSTVSSATSTTINKTWLPSWCFAIILALIASI
ncbi:hypothetical protein CB0940_00407 [Cercospora beticola]|uniref:Uncharacterized protein n=1 Tax=Cercospora beticola TaxID=122368 RepID=A0A2G5I7K0_CERBT|nr:hypothetical protein CB0940_00407 [Cercospora beticola]PIB00494.1 hypothetical protein CB0940_00407 [Cercospora beticola]WPA95824.1 hypothetical protein RHO25_000427 [Cercospora beticola]CAK1355921.1 unnamed protein product [Cercospora beticola]